MKRYDRIFPHPTREEEMEFRIGTAVRISLLILLIAMSMVWNFSRAQANWTQCAMENATCTFQGSKLIRYGEPWNNRWSPTRTMTSPVSCNNTTFAPDPSPGTGKRCEIMDAPVVTPPPPVIPPLPLGTAKYEVKWTPATQNTDGTPIGTILSTTIQVSDTPDFARVLQWVNTGPSTSYLVSQAPNMPVLYWRAGHATANGVSAWSTPSVRTERQVVEASKPVCWPKPVGSGTWVKGEQNSDGWALYWQCTNTAGVASHAGVMGLWSSMEPDWIRQLTTALANGSSAFDALWNAKASGPFDPSNYDPVRVLWTAMRDANPLPVVTPATFVVKPNGQFASRPATSLVNGTRTSTPAGRVAIKDAGGVAQRCDCVAHSSGTEANRYCAVTGLENVETAAVDVLGPSAAICTKVQ